MAFDATIDPGLLNRAEWVKFLALFFNAESTANALFRSDQAGVQSVTGASANLSAAAAGPRPLVVRGAAPGGRHHLFYPPAHTHPRAHSALRGTPPERAAARPPWNCPRRS